MYKLSLSIENWLPKSMNKSLRAHRYARDKENKAWDAYLWAQIGSKKPRKPLQSARVTLVRHAHRMLDFDGLVGSLKPVVDALVECRVLEDDRWGITGAWRVDQKYRPQAAGTLLEILVEELPPSDALDGVDRIVGAGLGLRPEGQ